MKKIKANISIMENQKWQLKEVDGYFTTEKLETGETVKLIVHRSHVYNKYWQVSEYTTGFSVTTKDYDALNTRKATLQSSIDYINRKLKENNITMEQLIDQVLAKGETKIANKDL